MQQEDWQKLKEVVLYIITATKGLDYYRVFKVLYFAEREHLKRYGKRIVPDDFVALPYGPVPTRLYDGIKEEDYSEIFDIVEDYTLIPIRNCNMDYLSTSNIECLDQSIRDNAGLSFPELKEKSHDTAWEKATKTRSRIISPIDMAIEAGASESIVNYIQEEELLEATLM